MLTLTPTGAKAFSPEGEDAQGDTGLRWYERRQRNNVIAATFWPTRRDVGQSMPTQQYNMVANGQRVGSVNAIEEDVPPRPLLLTPLSYFECCQVKPLQRF